ncbi:hypothetical protein GLOIN_2v1790377 [Rhizophagus clarus]|uniref:Uncharacterized protein n=1 Tax=Rhizophagus clarus TaxID=94130 RepID=A0A8H3L1B3_9GLOM|nr:hypothetical protein GLOIN_2v1790377 [Rhizophagus clarus]
MISTSSENEIESDYIISLESDEEYEIMSSDNKERHDSNILEEKLFVDEALAKDKLLSYDGDFAPYFQNLTTAALFCWIYKHNISTNAYEDLVDIIMRPEFNRDHIDSKIAYQLSISDIIWNVLNNPSLLKEMYFGAGVNSKTNPSTGMNQQYRLRIQKVLDYSDLPGTFKGELRQNRSLSGEVWLQDEPFLTIIISQILEKVAADTLRITKILYKHHTHWCIRDATFSYQYPSEYISIRQPPSPTIPVYKLFLDIYYDDFGTFRNVYHSLGGVYVQFGNMPARQRKLLKNHFVLGFVPFGGNFNEFMLPFISEMKEFKQGKLMEFGLRTRPSILDRLLRERHLQTPQDVYHATARKIGRLLKLTCKLFSQKGEDEFIKAWKNFEKPKKWSHLPNPISHNASFMMSDYLRLAMIMPFILNSFLETSSLKENESRTKTMRMVFESKFTLDSYDELQKCLEEEMKILPKDLWYSYKHSSWYQRDGMVHQIFKAMVPRTNCKNVELDLLKQYTMLFAIRHLVDEGADQRLSQSCRGFATMSSNFRNLLTNWYITKDKVSNE